jgi:serine phosphatase RsbU (regulator of sigma subunit)/anti-sigma regulatory factor (Ser/Thr protein kinase)/anti-anti-sigma regulatory factor
VFEQLPMMVVGLRGTDHRYVAVNAAYRTYLDGRPDLLGRPVRAVLPETKGQRFLELLDRVYRTGEPESGREWRIQLMDGPNGDKESYLDFTVAPQREGGEIVGLVVQVQDVTDRVLARRRVPEEQGRESLIALQEALLPAGLPVLPGVDIAGRYLVAEAPDAGGGDWFDAVPLGDGRVALVVGDVVGHGTAAAAVMGQLRAVIADQFAGGADLDTVVQRARRYAERNPAARSATMCAVVLDPGTGALSYVTCGHPAPLMVTPEGRARFLPPTGGTPLGTGGASPAVRAVLAAEEVLVLYTDGLVERPGESMAAGQAELAAVAADTAANRAFQRPAQTSVAQRVCAQTVELVARHTRLDDDVTVLVAQRRATPVGRFEQDMPAQAGLLALLRERLETWLRTLGAGSADLFNAQIAVVEAVSNAVEHAYPGGGGEVLIRGQLDGSGEVELTVRDFGQWRPVDPEPGLRGRGLVLIRRCMHTVVVNRAVEGTTVVMRRLLRAEAFLDPRATGRPLERSADLRVEFASSVRTAAPGERVRVVVTGPVDTVTGPRLRATLNEAGRGGVLPLTVDLREVTHLGSAGIQLLADLAAAGDGRQRLRLIAGPGSIARHVLDMTGLGHLVHDPDESGAG